MTTTSSKTETVLQLDASDLISSGARACYYHPHDPGLCVKVPLRQDNAIQVLQREVAAYHHVKDVLREYVIPCQDELVQTSRGIGIVCTLLRDEDGSISKSLRDYVIEGSLTDDMIRQLRGFFQICARHNLFFYDLNAKNFLIERRAGKDQLKYIDLKSYRRTQSFLQLYNLIPALGRMKMRRRMKRLFKHLGSKAQVIS